MGFRVNRSSAVQLGRLDLVGAASAARRCQSPVQIGTDIAPKTRPTLLSQLCVRNGQGQEIGKCYQSTVSANFDSCLDHEFYC